MSTLRIGLNPAFKNGILVYRQRLTGHCERLRLISIFTEHNLLGNCGDIVEHRYCIGVEGPCCIENESNHGRALSYR